MGFGLQFGSFAEYYLESVGLGDRVSDLRQNHSNLYHITTASTHTDATTCSTVYIQPTCRSA